jgi:hypothetical protein
MLRRLEGGYVENPIMLLLFLNPLNNLNTTTSVRNFYLKLRLNVNEVTLNTSLPTE